MHHSLKIQISLMICHSREQSDDASGGQVPVTVADAIGLSLWRYNEEALKPPIQEDKTNVNRWTMRMVEDGEVDYDFPALGRTRPIADFTSNNNRPARGGVGTSAMTNLLWLRPLKINSRRMRD
jgi:hypothetical protein